MINSVRKNNYSQREILEKFYIMNNNRFAFKEIFQMFGLDKDEVFKLNKIENIYFSEKKLLTNVSDLFIDINKSIDILWKNSDIFEKNKKLSEEDLQNLRNYLFYIEESVEGIYAMVFDDPEKKHDYSL